MPPDVREPLIIRRGIVCCRALGLSCAIVPGGVCAQQDQVGPAWMQLILAAPKLVLYAIGEIALFLAPLLAVLALAAWLAGRVSSRIADRVPSAALLGVLAVVLAVPGLIYWSVAPKDSSPRFRPVTVVKDAKVDALPPPVGRGWPRNTGYLDLPQGAQGGVGEIKVSGRASMHRVYVKLCEAGQPACPGLRHAYMKEATEFAFTGLPPGSYEVRYMPIDRPLVGGRSKPITISEYIEDPHEVRITDSPVLDSNYPVVGIRVEDF